MRRSLRRAHQLAGLALAGLAGVALPRAAPARQWDQWPSDALRGAHHRHQRVHEPRGRGAHHRSDRHDHDHDHHHQHRRPDAPEPPPPFSEGIPGIDSLSSFNVEVSAPGFGNDGTPQMNWVMNIIGSPPEAGGTTTIDAPILPVAIDLLDVDGALRVVDGAPLHLDPTPFVAPTLASPLFATESYTSSREPTQFADAIQRAQFFNRALASWHTWLAPVVRATRTLAIPFGAYRFALKADGSCCAFAAVDLRVFDRLLFPQTAGDTSTPLGAAQMTGEITTRDLTVVLLPNTVLYPPDTPSSCCILGFHSYDLEPGDDDNGNRERRFVVAIASWIDQGLLAGVEDVSAMSHEILEAVNDPFVGTDGVHNITPWWQEVSGTCQNKNEIGDVVQGLAGAVFPMATPAGRTYHLQNQALLPWFLSGQTSDAIDGAYSYPDQTLLTAPTPLLPRGCQ